MPGDTAAETRNWVSALGALASKAGATEVYDRTLRRLEQERAQQHPDTDALLHAAVETFNGAPNANTGLQKMCLTIHQQFTQLCQAEYAEVGVMFREDGTRTPEKEKFKNMPWTRMEAFHGREVFPKAKNVHKEELVVSRALSITVDHLFKGLYGTLCRTNRPVVSNDCDTDPQHIKMPKGHKHMVNLLGIPLWADSGAEPGPMLSGIGGEGIDPVQAFPLGDKEREMCGLYYFANTKMPGGWSEEFVSSLGAIQWGLGLLMYLGREIEALEEGKAGPHAKL